MLLNYYGIDITLQEFIDEYLVTSRVYEENGKRYGPSPALYYAGDPSSKTRGWGCFEPVIATAIQKIINDNQDKIGDNTVIEIIESNDKLPLYIYAYRSPIMIWTTIDYQEANEVYEWFSYDGQNTYTYPKNSHAIVITGVDDKYYYVNDPLKDEKNIKVPKNTLEKSFDSMGRQVIILDKYQLSPDFYEVY